MADISLSDFIKLILSELTDSFQLTAKPAQLFKLQASNVNLELPEEILNLHVSDIEFDLPAHIQVETNSSETKRLMISLPSKMATSFNSRLGRIRITIKPEQLSQSEKEL